MLRADRAGRGGRRRGGQGTPAPARAHTDLPGRPQGTGVGDGTAPPAMTPAVPAAAGAAAVGPG